MDLLERGLAPAANIVLNRYLTETRRIENLDALATLPFFLSMRAAIRAKVTAARLERAADADRPSIARAARAYFEFAARAIAPPGPAFVAVGGLSGTGKSLLARMLAPAVEPMPGAVDRALRRRAQGAFRAERSRETPEFRLHRRRQRPRLCHARRQGSPDRGRRHSVIVDAVFARPEERAAIAEAAKTARLPLQGLFLTADTATRLGRVGGRVRDASDADAAVAQAQERYELGHLEWAMVDASGTPEATLARAKAALHRP